MRSRFRSRFAIAVAAPAAVIAACGGSAPSPVTATTPPAIASSSAHVDRAWLHVSGNRIVDEDGKPFHGRGANLHDPRSCDGCTYLPLDVAETERRADALIRDWKATLIRFDLEAYASDAYPKGDRRVPSQWKSIIDDPAYFSAIRDIVRYMTLQGAYVLVSEWLDPTTTPNEWPTPATDREWSELARAFATDPHVLYGLVNEPHDAPAKDAEAFAALSRTVQTIRDAENAIGARHHIVAVPGIDGYARNVAYYVDHPITAGGGEQIVYEAHVYNPASDFEKMWIAPASKIPIVIGEFGPSTSPTMTLTDITTMMETAEKLGVPYIAWNFHANCPPNLLQKIEDAGACGVGMPLIPTADWGMLVKNRLAQPW